MTEKRELNSPQLQNHPDSAPRPSGNTWSPAAHPPKPGRSNAPGTETPLHRWGLASPKQRNVPPTPPSTRPPSPIDKPPSREREIRQQTTNNKKKKNSNKEVQKQIQDYEIEVVGGVVRVGIQRLLQHPEPLLVLEGKNADED